MKLLFGGLLLCFSSISQAGECIDGKGTVTLPDSAVYEGDFINCLLHGQGKLTWRDGTTYVGEFKNGLRHGKGKHISSAGWIYEGMFKDGMEEVQRP